MLSPEELASRLTSGLLSFPVTHLDSALRFDEPRYREHLAWQAGFDVAGLFAAGGTGEGFSLTPAEVDQVVRVTVQEVGDGVPVVAPATGATTVAVARVRAAQESGASGVLLMPPVLHQARAGVRARRHRRRPAGRGDGPDC
jgi:5-dehydro-4-deoxyglucarate dehydratase